MDKFSEDFLQKRLESLKENVEKWEKDLEDIDILDSYSRGINIGQRVQAESEIDSLRLLLNVDEEFSYTRNSLRDTFLKRDSSNNNNRN